MSFLLPDDRLLAMLREDVPYGDATTPGLGIAERRGQVVFRTRGTVTTCCVEEAERLMLPAGCTATRRLAASGAQRRPAPPRPPMPRRRRISAPPCPLCHDLADRPPHLS